MIKTTICAIGMGLFTAQLAGCGGDLEGQTRDKARHDKVSAAEMCEAVEGRAYSAIIEATGPDAPIPIERPFIHFGEDETVTYEIVGSGQAPTAGEYQCREGAIYLHGGERNDNPVKVRFRDENGEIITAVQGDYRIDMAVTDANCSEQPVCVVEPQDIQCVTTPCPTGVHKTIMQSDCAVDLPLPHTVVRKGECGELEGQPVFDEPEACTKEYAPVCAAVPTLEPCDTVPCPNLIHKTFGNDCMARAAQAYIISEGECGERLEGQVVTELSGICPAVEDPVCAKARAPIQCVTEPCPDHQYQTFSNECKAFFALAEIAFDDQCGELEGAVAFGSPLVQRVEELPSTDKRPSVTDVLFEGDSVSVTLGYSGCEEQHFHLYVSAAFLESDPVQVNTVFVPMVEDACDAALSTALRYDLTPLKHAYQQSYQTETGSIVLQGIGTYSF